MQGSSKSQPVLDARTAVAAVAVVVVVVVVVVVAVVVVVVVVVVSKLAATSRHRARPLSHAQQVEELAGRVALRLRLVHDKFLGSANVFSAETHLWKRDYDVSFLQMIR